MLEIFLTGLNAIGAVASIIGSLKGSINNRQLQTRLTAIEREVSTVMTELRGCSQSEEIPASVIEAYNQILVEVSTDPDFARYLNIRPTAHGTWLVTKRKKTTILRDLSGEY